ncbi:adenylate/guanylate cyclase domain-containing protein [Spirulina sp. CS-785/01]|uniref:adenylate/guanylate cyclase domain-containing protein n=1 Tax=Spirulina sp. CS-785/01 TaxID=3021716 RepID=UPI00232CDBEA|nr:adenylate/guanylate cyclase domain-containing protein [Spirulina sp. CS-785/01]MDB9313860.1 adenylate/guanylate cyclase domain-containing protein [Spirulina sp. CS-785/01]
MQRTAKRRPSQLSTHPSPLVFYKRSWAKNLPLRLLLIIPFVIQILATVSIIGWLSWRNGQKAVEDVTLQLRDEISHRIEDKLISYLETPRVINQVNADAIRSGQLNPDNFQQTIRQFWRQRNLFGVSDVSAMYFGSEDGEFVGLGYQEDQTWQATLVTPETNNRFYSYITDQQGNPLILLSKGNFYDPRIRPWYKDALKAGEATWSQIYGDFKERRFKITLAQPLYRGREFLGVVGVDFALSNIEEFLQNLNVGKTGETFIIERSGLLVAASVPGQMQQVKQGELSRYEAVMANSPLIRETARALAAQWSEFQDLKQSQHLDVMIKGKRQYVQVVPFSDGENLDWLIVVVIPEADFMARIHAQTQTTIILCLLALGIAIALGILTAHLLTRPILRLAEAANAITSGELKQRVKLGYFSELRLLAHAFNRMAQQLRETFGQLEATNQDLENRVKERTASLAQAEEKYRSIFENAAEGIFQSHPDQGYISANPSLAGIFGYDSPEALVQNLTSLDTQLYVNPQRRQDLLESLRERAFVVGFESQVYRADGSTIWIAENVRVVYDGAGNFCYYEGTVEDITRRKQAEDAIQRSTQQIRQQNKVLMRLTKNYLLTHGFLQEGLRVITKVTAKVLRVQRVSVWLLNESQDQLECVSCYGQESHHEETMSPLRVAEYPVYFAALEADEAVAVADLRLDPRTQMLSQSYYGENALVSVLNVPIRRTGKTLGVVSVEEFDQAREWTPEEENFMRSLADLVALAIEARDRRQAEAELRVEKQKSERLLLNILPESIAKQLKDETTLIAQHFDEVTILFADIVGFTPLSSQLDPLSLVNFLNEIFSSFDELAETLGLEKIKTIGDAYMVAAGLPLPREDHASAIAEMALSMQAVMKRFILPDGTPCQIRIGINTGVVVAGVIGTKKFIYDLWGDAVNIASRMESSGEPGSIQLTENTYQLLHSSYEFEPRGLIPVKGRGDMMTYWLKGRK